MSISIRLATHNDIPWLLGELSQFAQFYGTKRSLLGDESIAGARLTIMIDDHVFLVAEKEGVGPVGFIAGVYVPHMFNPDIKCLHESFWWVAEKHRGSRAGYMLFQAFKHWGELNADWVFFALEENSPVGDDFMIRNGFKSKERFFLLENP